MYYPTAGMIEIEEEFKKRMNVVLGRLKDPVDRLDELESITKIVSLCTKEGDNLVVERFGEMGIDLAMKEKKWKELKHFLPVLESAAYASDSLDYPVGHLMMWVNRKYYPGVLTMIKEDDELKDALMSSSITDWMVRPREDFESIVEDLDSMDYLLPKMIVEDIIREEWDSMSTEARRACMRSVAQGFPRFDHVIRDILKYNSEGDGVLSLDWGIHAMVAFGSMEKYPSLQDSDFLRVPAKPKFVKMCTAYVNKLLTKLTPFPPYLIAPFLVPSDV